MSPTPAPLRLVHHHPGRLRVRADAFLGDAAVFEVVRAEVSTIAGVARITHNPGAGSVLVEYIPGLADPDDIVDRIARAAGLGEVLDDVTARTRRRDPAEGVARAVRGVDGVVRLLGDERVGLGLAVPAALASAAVVSLALMDRKDLMPRWDNLLWWSYSLFRDWNERAIAATDEAT